MMQVECNIYTINYTMVLLEVYPNFPLMSKLFFLQLITNNKFVHRVLAQKIGPRVSVSSFFRQHLLPENSKIYEPISELLTPNNPPVYKETSVKDLVSHHNGKGLDGTSALGPFRL